MSTEKLPATFFEKHLLFTSAKDVQQICQPFFDKSKTTYFNYVKRYHNGSKMCLCNNAAWMRYFYEHRLYEDIYIENKTLNQEKPRAGGVVIVLWAGLIDSKVVQEQSRHFNIGHGISLSFAHNDCIEYCYFGTENKNSEMSHWYINNIPALMNFIHYFKEHAAPLIKEAGLPKNLITISKHSNIKLAKQQENFSWTDDDSAFIKPKHYFIHTRNGDISITAKEMDCIRLIARGYPASKIGEEMNISERTVEKHLANAKAKLSCSSKSDLIGVILDSGLNRLIDIS